MGGRRVAELDLVAREAATILSVYQLCDQCLGRMYARRLALRSAGRLGARLRKGADAGAPLGARRAGGRGPEGAGAAAPTGSHSTPRQGRGPEGAGAGAAPVCYICRGLLSSLGPYTERMVARAEAYEFATAMVGVTPRPSMIERDDEVRSRFGLAGAPPLRAALSSALSAALSRAARCAIARDRPDLTITVNLREDTVEARSRALVVYGRYTKSERGLPQKQGACAGCGGRGCGQCALGGLSPGEGSVEALVAGFVCSELGARRARMTWIGGEGADSLVSGEGRPFYASVPDPARRGRGLPGQAELGPVSLRRLGLAPSVPSRPVRFSTVAEMSLRAARPVSDSELDAVASAMGGRTAAVYGGPAGRGRQERALGPARCARESPDLFALTVDAEGGIPLRELAGGEVVFPNASSVLGAECAIERLDILDVRADGPWAGGGGGDKDGRSAPAAGPGPRPRPPSPGGPRRHSYK